jgi:hypothetical protein
VREDPALGYEKKRPPHQGAFFIIGFIVALECLFGSGGMCSPPILPALRNGGASRLDVTARETASNRSSFSLSSSRSCFQRIWSKSLIKVPTTFLKSRPLPCFSNMAGGYFLGLYGDNQNPTAILEGESHIFLHIAVKKITSYFK